MSERTGGQASEDAPPGGRFHFTGYVLPPPRAATQAVKMSLERPQQQKSVTSTISHRTEEVCHEHKEQARNLQSVPVLYVRDIQ